DTTQSSCNVSVFTYTITVTDANGCTATASATLTEPPLLLDSLVVDTFSGGWNTSCNGACDGSVTAYPYGGTAPYSYLWNTVPAQTTQTATNLCAGTYCVTITDANGCSTTDCVTLTQPPQTVTVTITAFTFPGGANVSCIGACDGSATANPSGGTGPYSYVWSTVPPQLTQTATGLCAITYTVTVTDANNCTATASITLTEPLAVTVSIAAITFAGGWNEPCNGDCLGSAIATPGGGVSPYTYLWSTVPPQLTATATGLCATTYTVTITDVNGCTATNSVTLNQPPVLVVSDTVSVLNPPYNTSCPNSCDAFATVYPSGGTPPYSYQWAAPLSDTTAYVDTLLCGSFTGIVYTYTVTDANGCSVTDSILVVDPYNPISVISTPDASICANSITLIANVPLPIYSGHWEVISGTGIFIPDTLSPVVLVSGLSWGLNCFVWFVGDTACIARDTVCIQATQPVIANAGGKYPDFCEADEPIHLHADTAYTGIGTWTAIGPDALHPSPVTFTNPNDPNTFASNFGWGSNTLVWTVVDGPCRDADTIKITKIIPEKCDSTCLEMPTAFSPNGDGDNDHFIIHCIEYSFNRQNKLIIFNRWGNEVYSKEMYLNEWYGQNNKGGLLPDGTYFAILTISNPGINQGKVLKGYVDLRR
ncbi:MAG: gliding motility-associated C-terminal domain-containing protein, partial [Bacteroidia bacterium]|nr:gliding motility-associated C-terminal domain-containing protein [Bacteroidia bacterium]